MTSAQGADTRERELFEAFWYDTTLADKTKQYSISPADVDEVRRLAADVAFKSFKAGRASISAPAPVAWLRNLTDPQPHAITNLKYRSAAAADAGVEYIPVYAAPAPVAAEGAKPIAYPDADLSSGLSMTSILICGDRASIDRVQGALHNAEYVLPQVRDELVRARAVASVAAEGASTVEGAGGWISVDERLPAKDEPVLVFTPDGPMFTSIDEWCTYHEAPVGWSSVTIETGEGWANHEFEQVTHWAPLPLPPLPAPPSTQGDGA